MWKDIYLFITDPWAVLGRGPWLYINLHFKCLWLKVSPKCKFRLSGFILAPVCASRVLSLHLGHRAKVNICSYRFLFIFFFNYVRLPIPLKDGSLKLLVCTLFLQCEPKCKHFFYLLYFLYWCFLIFMQNNAFIWPGIICYILSL